MCIMRDHVFTKCMNALQQVQKNKIISHIFTIVFKVTAREGKPILIVEEGDTETCKWAEHSLEVMMTTPYLPAAHTQIPYI